MVVSTKMLLHIVFQLLSCGRDAPYISVFILAFWTLSVGNIWLTKAALIFHFVSLDSRVGLKEWNAPGFGFSISPPHFLQQNGMSIKPVLKGQSRLDLDGLSGHIPDPRTTQLIFCIPAECRNEVISSQNMCFYINMHFYTLSCHSTPCSNIIVEPCLDIELVALCPDQSLCSSIGLAPCRSGQSSLHPLSLPGLCLFHCHSLIVFFSFLFFVHMRLLQCRGFTSSIAVISPSVHLDIKSQTDRK